ncbi:unnamed protein product [Heterobilharzia americana]|nr:unnamed protein product [Heterobilharzia americana]
MLPPNTDFYDEKCPETEKLAVYKTSPDVYIGPFEITTQSQTPIKVGEKIVLNFLIPIGFLNLSGPKFYELYYGDTFQLTENISDITAPLEVIYDSPGSIWPKLTARNENGTITGSASLELMIYETITGADLVLKCPPVVVLGVIFVCQLIASKGSHLQGNVYFANEWQDSFALPEAHYDWIGLTPRRNNDRFINYVTNNLVITGNQARYSGTITTIQVHARLPGDITFYMYRAKLIAAGWQSIKLLPAWIVQPGDRIGFTNAGGGSIHCAPSDSYEPEDLESLTLFSGINGSFVFKVI